MTELYEEPFAVDPSSFAREYATAWGMLGFNVCMHIWFAYLRTCAKASGAPDAFLALIPTELPRATRSRVHYEAA
jgi:predicted amidohydrolase